MDEKIAYLELGQRWTAQDGADEVRVVDIEGHRWVIEDRSGSRQPWTAHQLRQTFRLVSN
jgi:hypothetical protein